MVAFLYPPFPARNERIILPPSRGKRGRILTKANPKLIVNRSSVIFGSCRKGEKTLISMAKIILSSGPARAVSASAMGSLKSE